MLKLLLVDDQPRELEGMKGMLKWDELGVEIVGCATNGRQALAMIGQMPVDIVITDVMMPDIDGIQLIREMKRLHPHIRSICISGFDEFKLVSQAINSGASGYVLKPVLTGEIKSTLERVIEDIRKESLSASALEIALAYLCADARDWMAKLCPSLLEIRVVAGVGEVPEDVQPLAAIALSDGKQAWLVAPEAIVPEDAPTVGPLLLRDLQQPLLRLLQNDHPPVAAGAELSAVETIRQNIHNHLCESMDDETLLKGVYLSRSYANVLFKNETGMTIHRYIKQERLKHAMHLLLEYPETKVTTIAQQCCFSDASHLTNSMQKHFGITPEKYRRRNGKL